MKKLVFAAIIVFVSLPSVGGILNGSFECSEPNVSEWFEPPCQWVHENYAGAHSVFIPTPELENGRRDEVNWSVPATVEGNNFCVLSTGDMGDGSDSLITSSSIKQRIVLNPGDYLKGSYFFGTCDWSPFLDAATITLTSAKRETDPNFIELVQVSVQDVGDCSSMDDWAPIFYAYTGLQASEYDLVCEVHDVRDTIFKSYLVIDNLHICRVAENEGDLNRDCEVNIEDFALFSMAWLATCSDPNTYDPNAPCDFADMDDSDLVDLDDLNIMSAWWLYL